MLILYGSTFDLVLLFKLTYFIWDSSNSQNYIINYLFQTEPARYKILEQLDSCFNSIYNFFQLFGKISSHLNDFFHFVTLNKTICICKFYIIINTNIEESFTWYYFSVLTDTSTFISVISDIGNLNIQNTFWTCLPVEYWCCTQYCL